MKRQLLTFAFLLFLYTQTKAQTSVYHPFPDSNAYWNEQTASSVDGIQYNVKIYSIFIDGDTIIGGKIHHKLYENGYHALDGYLDQSEFFSNQYAGAIWQDSDDKQLFFVPFYGSSDTILYDFNLSLGSFLPSSYINDPGTGNYVSSIDSILIGNSYRKRFWISVFGAPDYDNDSNYIALIEGIGSTFGLENGMFPYFEAWATLECFSQNGQALWPDSSTSCNIETVVKEFKQDYSISLYPNPVTNQLTIQTSSLHSNEAVTVSIINVLGEIIYAEQHNGTQETINCKSFPAGIYFVQLTTAQDRWVGRFVKE